MVDKQGNPVPANQGGLLVIKQPWPAMLRTISATTSAIGSSTGRRCRTATSPPTAPAATTDGYIWVMGRVDDVLNVAGHRLSTMEVESALVHHPKVAEAAVVGKPDEIKGEAIACFVTLERRHRSRRTS